MSLPRMFSVVSGKGGVGKTNVVVNLAVAAAGRGARVLVVDGDLGLANVDVLLGLAPERSVSDVLAGACSLEEALVEGPRGIRILPAASGRSGLAALAGGRLGRLVGQIWQAAADHDLVLVDAGAGIGPAVIGLAAACPRGLVVATPEPTSLADAYATWKVLTLGAPALRLQLLVTGAASELDARRTHDHVERMARRFLDVPVPFAGHLPHDLRLRAAVARQRAVVEAYPQADWSRHLHRVADSLLGETPRVDAIPSADLRSATGVSPS